VPIEARHRPIGTSYFFTTIPFWELARTRANTDDFDMWKPEMSFRNHG